MYILMDCRLLLWRVLHFPFSNVMYITMSKLLLFMSYICLYILICDSMLLLILFDICIFTETAIENDFMTVVSLLLRIVNTIMCIELNEQKRFFNGHANILFLSSEF